MSEQDDHTPTSDEATSPTPKKPLLRRILSGTLKFFAILVILVVVLLVFTQTDYFKNSILKPQLISATNNALEGRIELGSIEGNLFTGVIANDLEVYDANDKLAVAMARAEAEYNLLGLLDGELLITRLKLVRPLGLVLTNDEGALNLATIAKASEDQEKASDPIGISVEGITVERGALLYIDERELVFEEDASLAGMKKLRTLLDDPDSLREVSMFEAANDIMRQLYNSQGGPVPGAALISELTVAGDFSLNKQAVIGVTLRQLDAELDANTWVGQQSLKSKGLAVKYGPKYVRVVSDSLRIGETSGWKELKLGANFSPSKLADEAPELELFHARIPELTITRELATAVLPMVDIRDGFSAHIAVAGKPASARAMIKGRALDSGGTFHIFASAKELLSQLMAGTLSFTEPNATPPAYELSARFDNLDPSAIVPDVPALTLNGLVDVRGKGVNLNTLEASARVDLGSSSALNTYDLDSAYLDATFADGQLTIAPSTIRSPYVDVDLKGFAKLGGGFDLSLAVRADETHKRSFDIPNVATLAQERVDLKVNARGQLDRDLKDPLEMLTRADLTATWDIAGLSFMDYTLGESRAAIDLDMTSPDAMTRKLVYDLDVMAARVNAPAQELSAELADINTQGSVTFPLPLTDPLSLLDRLTTNAKIVARDVKAPGVRLGGANVSLRLEPSSAGQTRYDLDGSVSGLGLSSASLSLGSARADLGGVLSLSQSGDLRYVSAKGDVKVQRLNASGNRVGAADVKLDVAGSPPSDFHGDISLTAQDIDAGGQRLKTAQASASLGTDEHFTLSAQVQRLDASPENLKVTASGKLLGNFSGVENLQADLYNLDADASDPIWHIEDAKIVSRGGELVFENVELVNDNQRLSISGVYRKSGKQDLSVEATNVNLGQLREELGLQELIPAVEGEVEQLSFVLAGTTREPFITIDIILKDFMYEGTGPFDIILKGRYKDEKLTVNTLDIDGWKTDLLRAQARIPVKLDLNGNYDIYWKQPLLMSLFIDPIDLEQLGSRVEQLKEYELGGVVEGGGIINGTLEKPMLDISVNAREIKARTSINGSELDLSGFALATRFEYEPPTSEGGGFKTTNTLISTNSGTARDLATLNASSPLPVAEWLYRIVERGRSVDYAREIFRQPFDLEAKVNQIDLTYLNTTGIMPEPQLAGAVDFVFKGQGTFGDPSLRVDLDLVDVSARGELGSQTVDFRDIDSHTSLRFGTLETSSDQLTFETDFSMQGAQVIGASGFMSLPLSDWFERIAIKGEAFDWTKQILARRFDLKLAIKDFDLTRIAISPLFTEPDIAGIVNVDFTASGVLRDPSARLAIDLGERVGPQGQETTVGGLGYDRYRDIVFSARADVKDKVLTLERLGMNWDSTDIFTMKGKVPLPLDTMISGAKLEDLPLDFSLEVHPVPLNKLSAIDYYFASLNGIINGHIMGKGSLRQPDVSGRIALTNARLSGQNKGTIATEIAFGEGLASMHAELCQNSAKVVQTDAIARINTDLIQLINGADPTAFSEASRSGLRELKAGEDLRVKIQTRDNRPVDLEQILPQKLISKYAKGIKGLLLANIEVFGTYDALTADGVLQLERGAITLESYGRRFTGITVDTRVDSQKIELKEVSLDEGNTGVSLSGVVEHKNFAPGKVNLELVSDTFNIGEFVDFPFFASGKVNAKGRLDGEAMAMNVDIQELDVSLPEDISSDLHDTELDEDIVVLSDKTSLRRKKNANEVLGADSELFDDQDSFASAIKAVVNVKIRRDAWVRHPYGDVNFMGDFVVRLNGTEATLNGQVETLRGQVEFLSKTFNVTRGLVTFTGAYPPNPRLQIEASYMLDRSVTASIGQASNGDPRVIVAVEGSASDPVLRLRSDPSMSETDILYVLATGRPPNSADVGQDTSVASAALSAASGVVLGMLRDELSDTIPLDFFDVLRVDTTNLEVGKYVNNGKIYLSYRRLFGAADQSAESVYEFEYHFAPKWSVEAQARDGDQGGQLDFNVFWDAY